MLVNKKLNKNISWEVTSELTDEFFRVYSCNSLVDSNVFLRHFDFYVPDTLGDTLDELENLIKDALLLV